MKIYLYAAAALAIIGLAWYEIRVHKKAGERDAAVKALTDERKAHSAEISKIKTQLDESYVERRKLSKGLTEITARFNKPLPAPKTLIKTVQVPGEACPRVGVSDSYVWLWNDASSPGDTKATAN